MYIYKITNKINGKVYIGQTRQTLEKRWQRHKDNSRKCNHALSNAMKKYGIKAFSLEVIEEVIDPSLLDNREIYWINYYKSTNKQNGYNLTSGGEGGYVRSEETKKKISIAKKGCEGYWKGKNLSEEAKEKIRQARIGIKQTQESNEKNRQAQLGSKNHFFGKRHTEETKKKISLANTKTDYIQWKPYSLCKSEEERKQRARAAVRKCRINKKLRDLNQNILTNAS